LRPPLDTACPNCSWTFIRDTHGIVATLVYKPEGGGFGSPWGQWIRQATKKEQADKHAQGNNKNNEGKQHRNKTQMENMQSVTTWRKKKAKKTAAKQNPSGIWKYKYPTHLKMAM
jgi:hypothetical protein